jgi:hypothetical protein
MSLSFENKQNLLKIEFHSNSIHLSINICNHNKNDFLWSYNARSNIKIFLNYLYSFDIWQYIFSSLKTFKKTFTPFNCLTLRWKSTTNVIIMQNIFNAKIAAYTFWTLFIFCKSSRIIIRALYLKRKLFESNL